MFALLFAACGGGSPPNASILPPLQNETIDFAPAGEGWDSEPIEDMLDDVSNNGFGYTGEIDVFVVTAPAPGRMVFSLSWEHAANFDLIIAADPEADHRLAGGFSSGAHPEYVNLPVARNQVLYVFVAGWEGSPGKYLLETALIPFEEPVFDLEAAPDFSQPIVRNAPLFFTFNKELDPNQDIGAGLVLQTAGHAATGHWCAEGRDVAFYPALPEFPGDPGAFLPDTPYTLQFAPAALGVRAQNGEYLEAVITFTVVAAAEFVDEDPQDPPRVVDVDHPETEPWLGTPVTISVFGALDPLHVRVELYHVDDQNVETPIPNSFILRQQFKCSGSVTARLTIEPLAPLPPASHLRVRMPATVRGISGLAAPHNLLRGPDAGPGFVLDLHTP